MTARCLREYPSHFQCEFHIHTLPFHPLSHPFSSHASNSNLAPHPSSPPSPTTQELTIDASVAVVDPPPAKARHQEEVTKVKGSMEKSLLASMEDRLRWRWFMGLGALSTSMFSTSHFVHTDHGYTICCWMLADEYGEMQLRSRHATRKPQQNPILDRPKPSRPHPTDHYPRTCHLKLRLQHQRRRQTSRQRRR